eukprot:4506082-Prorocentrum_lima.AAC.1
MMAEASVARNTSKSAATSCRMYLPIAAPTLENWSVFVTTPSSSLICSTTDATRCCKQSFVSG